MASKNIKIGSLFVTEINGQKRVSIGLGNKSKDPKYNLTVELVVKDHEGKVVSRQTDGFVNLIDPRTQADDLLKAGIISDEIAQKMRDSAAKLPDKIKYSLQVARSS